MIHILRIRQFVWLTAILMTSSCTQTLEPLKKRDAVERTKSIVVFGVEWEQEFINVFTDEIELTKSARYYADENWPVTDDAYDKSQDVASKIRHEPVVNNFRIVMNGTTDKNFAIQFYDAYKKQHKFQPFTLVGQTLTTELILYTARYLNADYSGTDDNRYYAFPSKFKLPAYSVEFDGGEIVYGGTFKFYFHSNKQWFGLAPREQVNSDLTLTGWEVVDQFDEMKEYFRLNYEWFPEKEIRNATKPVAYKRNFLEWVPIEAEELHGDKERDKDKFFY